MYDSECGKKRGGKERVTVVVERGQGGVGAEKNKRYKYIGTLLSE